MPYAIANIYGNHLASNLYGTIKLYPWHQGTLVQTEIFNLPINQNKSLFFGFHLHEGNTCENNFKKVGGHYNPTNQQHPLHAGDLPPLLSNNSGYAYAVIYTERFKPSEVINRVFIIHQNPDDFRTQPSGDSGPMIACGVIEKI
jgi:Cu-Zn family superoxide dismutase